MSRRSSIHDADEPQPPGSLARSPSTVRRAAVSLDPTAAAPEPSKPDFKRLLREANDAMGAALDTRLNEALKPNLGESDVRDIFALLKSSSVRIIDDLYRCAHFVPSIFVGRAPLYRWGTSVASTSQSISSRGL